MEKNRRIPENLYQPGQPGNNPFRTAGKNGNRNTAAVPGSDADVHVRICGRNRTRLLPEDVLNRAQTLSGGVFIYGTKSKCKNTARKAPLSILQNK